MRPKQLSNAELIDITSIYHDKYRQKNWGANTAQLWYSVCVEFLSRKYKGSMLITENVRQAEERILQNDEWCKEYVSALMKTVDTDLVQLTEHQKIVLIIMATSDEREEAIKFIQS